MEEKALSNSLAFSWHVDDHRSVILWDSADLLIDHCQRKQSECTTAYSRAIPEIACVFASRKLMNRIFDLYAKPQDTHSDLNSFWSSLHAKIEYRLLCGMPWSSKGKQVYQSWDNSIAQSNTKKKTKKQRQKLWAKIRCLIPKISDIAQDASTGEPWIMNQRSTEVNCKVVPCGSMALCRAKTWKAF